METGSNKNIRRGVDCSHRQCNSGQFGLLDLAHLAHNQAEEEKTAGRERKSKHGRPTDREVREADDGR